MNSSNGLSLDATYKSDVQSTVNSLLKNEIDTEQIQISCYVFCNQMMKQINIVKTTGLLGTHAVVSIGRLPSTYEGFSDHMKF